jgi:hypothetical protein
MSDDLERAQEGIEHAHHAHEGGVSWARRIAILISILAAALAIAEMGEKSAQNQFLANHVTLSDDYAFYQAKTERWDTLRATADVLDSLPNAADPAVRARGDKLRAEAARLNDDVKTQGRKQLLARTEGDKAARDEAFHHYHSYEWVVGALQIAIVLASVSVVTRVALLWMVAAGIGGVSVVFALAVWAGIIG